MKEKDAQEKLRKHLGRLGCVTRKMVGAVALPGMPDLLGVTDRGLLFLAELKLGRPSTECQAISLLKGAQVAVLCAMSGVGAPCFLIVGDDAGRYAVVPLWQMAWPGDDTAQLSWHEDAEDAALGVLEAMEDWVEQKASKEN